MDVRQLQKPLPWSRGAELRYQNHHHGDFLLDCIDPDIERAAERFTKITTKAANLVTWR